MGVVKPNSTDSLFYQHFEGDKDKPCLIFLHEGLGCHAMWKGFPEKVNRETGYPVLSYDRKGYGMSSALNGKRTIHYLHDYALKELPFVIDSVIPDQPYILIGHSDGGSISLIHAAGNPSMLKGTITIAAHVFAEKLTLDGIRIAGKAFDEGRMNKLEIYHGEKTESMFKAWEETWLSEWFRDWNIEYLLPAIQSPVLAVQGREDQYGTIKQVDSIVERAGGPSEPCIIPDCAHSPHVETPDTLCRIIAEFADKL